jgi:hypothetical protein
MYGQLKVVAWSLTPCITPIFCPREYADHLPLYRQSQIYARAGLDLDRSTLADWVGGAHALFEPLVAALGRNVLSATHLHADDTPYPVLAPVVRKKPFTGKQPRANIHDVVHQGLIRLGQHTILRDDVAKRAPGGLS